jgi:hypothetical protein
MATTATNNSAVALSSIDVGKLQDAVKLIVPLIPKAWFTSTILILTIANAVQLLLGAFTPLLTPTTATVIGSILSIVIGILRVVRPNPPIAGGPHDPTTP